MAEDRPQEPEPTDPLAGEAMVLADEFLERLHRGERPELSEFVSRRPDLEGRLREVLGMMLELEGASGRAPLEQRPPREFGPYRIVREIGRGGMGVVYEALQKNLGRRIALKVMTSALHASPTAIDRFQREALIASRLSHPGICAVHDAGILEGIPFIALAYIEGETLAQRLGRRGTDLPTQALDRRLDPEAGDTLQEPPAAAPAIPPAAKEEIDDLLRILESAARALHAAHSAGVLHRDLKPGNIIITPKGDPVLLDFGLAREIESPSPDLTAPGDVVGTPSYLAPEQIAQERPDRRTDVWALGATLYEALAGRKAFAAPTREMLYLAIRQEDPPPLTRRNRHVPRDVAAVVATALEKDPARRYATAAEFADDLGRARRREPIHARPPGAWTRCLRSVARHPTRAAQALTAALLAIASAGFLAYFVGTRDDVLAAREEARRSRIESLLAEGFFHLGWQEPGPALPPLQEAFELDPGPETALGVALALLEAHRFDACAAFLDAHADLEAATPALRLIRSNLLKIAGREAEALALSAAIPPPATAFDHFVRGLSNLGKPAKAGRASALRTFEDLTDAVALSGRARQIHHVLRVRAAGALRDPDLVTRCALPLLKTWPDSPVTWLAIGMAADAAGAPADAAKAFRRATEIAPADVEAWTALAESQRRAGDPAAALSAALEAVRLDPDDARGAFALGNAHQALGHLEEAAACYERASAADPSLVVARVNLAGIARASGNLERAREILEDARRAFPEDHGATYVLGVVRAEAGDLEEAAALLREAVRSRPEDPETRFALAKVLGGLDRGAEALEEGRAAVRLASGDARIAGTVARILLDEGLGAEAESVVRRLLEAHPGHPVARELLAEALLDQSELHEARETLEELAKAPDLEAEAPGRIRGMLEACSRRIEERARWTAVLADEATGASAEELASLARAAAAAGAHAPAARLFERFFASEGGVAAAPPALRQDAILATLAAGGAWRDPARAWLEAELGRLEAAGSGTTLARDAARLVERLRASPGYAAALDDPSPAADAAAWRALSLRVDRLEQEIR